jgi:hypothetical protein
MSRNPWEGLRQSTSATAEVARRAIGMGIPIVNITEDVRKYAAEQKITEAEALEKGMAEKSAEFAEQGAELYQKA